MGTIVMTDAELLEASRRGERDAFGRLVERYQRMVSAVSYSRTRNQALSEDVAQETFIAAWRQLDQLREPNRLRSWLCGIARNLARKAKRRTDREVPEAETELAAQDNPFDAVCEAQAERVVGEALARVPESYRDVLVLYYREQQSVREVSDALGITEAATMQRLSRGRQYLANGVTSLVEKSLRGQRPKRNLVASVLAALPAASIMTPSRVEASPSSHGGNMFKLALAAAAFTAAGTTAIVVTRTSDPAPTSVAASASPTTTAATTNARVAQAPKFAPRKQALGAPAPAEGPRLLERAPEPDADRVLDAATIKQLRLDRGPGRGPADAPVTITMFTDLQCQFCGKAHGSLDQLFDEYPGKLRLVIKQMPVHRTAELAAEAAHAAEAQGKFRELNDLMIANPEDLSRDAILGLAQQAGLDVPKLREALDKHTYADAVEEDKTTASALEFNGTPAFVINGRRIVGYRPLEDFRQMIEAALKE
jgi:RNA polymerase sigma factor (sigma-70 family)